MNKGLKPGPGGWTNVELATRNGVVSVLAQIIGPFAVHADYDYYTISHWRTGCSMRKLVPTMAQAASIARDLRVALSDTDLDLPNPEDVIAAIRAVPAAMKHVIGTPPESDSHFSDDGYDEFRERAR